MAEEHPLKLAAIAVVGTITVGTLVVTQWIVPTLTASLSHELTLAKEKASATQVEIATIKSEREKLSAAIEDEKSKAQKESVALLAENKVLKEKLFNAEKVNSFLKGDPYPVGLDKIKLGESKDKVLTIYQGANLVETPRSVRIKQTNDLFREIRYNHSARKPGEGKIESIQYDLGTLDRIRDRNLPTVPKNWLAESLAKALGEPDVIGLDNDCLVWKIADNAVVYYVKDTDWFEINGLATYPPACSMTDEQFKEAKKRREQRR